MRTMQRGMGGVPAEAFRYSVGDMPTRSRKRELNEPTLWNPTRKQISVISWLIARTGLDVDSIKPPAGGVPLAGTPVSWLRLENRRWLLVWHYDRRHTNTCGSESRAEVPAEANRCTCNPNIPKSTRSATRPYQREIAEVIGRQLHLPTASAPADQSVFSAWSSRATSRPRARRAVRGRRPKVRVLGVSTVVTRIRGTVLSHEIGRVGVCRKPIP